MKNNFSVRLSFFNLLKSTSFLLFILLFLHLFWAWYWPVFNDESYYWDWARNMFLSYVDAPPAVSWVALAGSSLLPGALGARLLVPFLNLFSAIFLLKSADILAQGTKSAQYIVILLFAGIPIFSINGTMLMPDAPLLFACSGALYFALKSCEKFVCKTFDSLNLKYSIPLGAFIGLGILSKYQSIPLSIGFFIAIASLRGFKKTFTKDSLFWFITIFCAVVVSSPLFVWNFQNNFASFKFQGQHGFSTWDLNIKNFFVYILAIIFIIFPWYFYLFVKQISQSFKNKFFFHSLGSVDICICPECRCASARSEARGAPRARRARKATSNETYAQNDNCNLRKCKCQQSLDCIPIFASFSIFIFIGSAALGNKTEAHWITPGFLFLIPLVASRWDALTLNHPKFWKNISIISCILMILTATFAFTRPVQTLLSQNKIIFGYNISKIHKGLYGNLIWANIKNPEETIAKYVPLELAEKKYFYDLNITKCADEPYLAAFSWRWASQFAFHLKNNPRVFVFNLARTTYYSWRDSLPFMSGCHFYIIGPKSMYDAKEIERVMIIESTKEFTVLEDYTNKPMPMIFIDGIMKDYHTLQKIATAHLQRPRY